MERLAAKPDSSRVKALGLCIDFLRGAAPASHTARHGIRASVNWVLVQGSDLSCHSGDL